MIPLLPFPRVHSVRKPQIAWFESLLAACSFGWLFCSNRQHSAYAGWKSSLASYTLPTDSSPCAAVESGFWLRTWVVEWSFQMSQSAHWSRSVPCLPADRSLLFSGWTRPCSCALVLSVTCCSPAPNFPFGHCTFEVFPRIRLGTRKGSVFPLGAWVCVPGLWPWCHSAAFTPPDRAWNVLPCPPDPVATALCTHLSLLSFPLPPVLFFGWESSDYRIQLVML